MPKAGYDFYLTTAEELFFVTTFCGNDVPLTGDFVCEGGDTRVTFLRDGLERLVRAEIDAFNAKTREITYVADTERIDRFTEVSISPVRTSERQAIYEWEGEILASIRESVISGQIDQPPDTQRVELKEIAPFGAVVLLREWYDFPLRFLTGTGWVYDESHQLEQIDDLLPATEPLGDGCEPVDAEAKRCPRARPHYDADGRVDAYFEPYNLRWVAVSDECCGDYCDPPPDARYWHPPE